VVTWVCVGPEVKESVKVQVAALQSMGLGWAAAPKAARSAIATVHVNGEDMGLLSGW
jgi:hypothetical protein